MGVHATDVQCDPTVRAHVNGFFRLERNLTLRAVPANLGMVLLAIMRIPAIGMHRL
jgi:hypothetical protein